ncbi:MAG TPA: CAP domain-containing protein [Baekduia sp.]|uniref:CAP domain-containing protein n=1 Tax=Baekduia sp. TaxID=2600305 RepID=UPI002D77BAF7|nr:CAP domain-containing protein [Baekduia sp.]HET6509792.1 CAP domain-containing protein [Baekduia sp.]
MPAAAPPPAHTTSSRAEIAIVREINRVRRTHHLKPVKLIAPLAKVARRHSSLMLKHDALTHSSFDGSSFSTRLAKAGKRRTYGETLAWAPDGSHVNAKALLKLWLTSAPHRHVLLDGQLHRVGVGRVHGKLAGQAGDAITADFSS